MLVVVEDRYLHAVAQLAFHIKTVRSLDVLQIDTAKGRLQRRDDIDQLVEVVFLVDLDVEDVDTGKLLEQDGLSLHHRLRRQRPDVAQPQHRRSVGDDRDQVAAAGVLERVVWVLDDFLARGGDPGRIGQRQVVLVHQLLGRLHRNLPRRRKFVVLKRGAAQLIALLFGAPFGIGHGAPVLPVGLAQSASRRLLWGSRIVGDGVFIPPSTPRSRGHPPEHHG